MHEAPYFKTFKELRIKDPSEPWSNLILPDLNRPFLGIPLRIFSPYHGMELNLFPKNQLETYIDKVWTYYTKKNLRVSVSGANTRALFIARDRTKTFSSSSRPPDPGCHQS